MNLDHELNQLAAAQGGVVTRSQAIQSGLTPSQVDQRVRTQQWLPFSPGAYRLFRLQDELADVRAAVAVLPNAVASHSSACTIHGLDNQSLGWNCVSVHTQTTHVFPGVRVVRCHDLLDHHVETLVGLKVTTVARTIVDLGAHLPLGRLGSVLDSAMSKQLVEVDAVQAVLDEVARRGKPGVRVMREVLAERGGRRRSGSVLELRGLRLLDEGGLSGFQVEHPIPWSPKQRFDLAFPGQRLAVEWDSRTWHAIQEGFESDRRRDRAAVVHGWRILRFTWSDVHDRPDIVLSTIRVVLG